MTKLRDFEIVSNFQENLENFKKPVRATKYSAGYDIFNNTGKDIIIKSGEISEAITTSLKTYMLPDEFLSIHVRSGHGSKYSVRLCNSFGVIDADYYNNSKNEGEFFVKFHNQGPKDLIIPIGEAMAQGIFLKYLVTDSDESENVRTGGFGSTT